MYLLCIYVALQGFWGELHIFSSRFLARNSRTISTRVEHGHMENTLFFSYVYIASIMHKYFYSSSSQPRFSLLENLSKNFPSFPATKKKCLFKRRTFFLARAIRKILNWLLLIPHCSKSSLFVQKFNFDFPWKLSIFLGEKLGTMLWFWTF